MPVIIRLEGSRQLRDKLGRFDSAIDTEAKAIIRDVSTAAAKVAQGLAPKDLGAGAKSIHAEVHGLSANLVTRVPYMVVQEYGRRPGKKGPSTTHIFEWAMRHGAKSTREIWAIARSIHVKGFPAKKFMEKASLEAERILQQRLAKARAIMVQWWYGRG